MPQVMPVDRAVVRLAVPALGALLAEPLFLLTDSAIVGHLGAPPLAALGLAGTVLATVVSLAIFLAYGTTSAVARSLGSGDLRAAVRQGVDGCWLGAGLGVLLAVLGIPLARPVLAVAGAGGEVTDLATTYLRISLLGLPAMLLVLAATGVLRGLQDTRTPLVVAAAGAAGNVVLNLGLVYGIGSWPGLGLAGSALGTVVAQVAMAGAFVLVVRAGATGAGVGLRPDQAGVRRALGAGLPLVVRTAAMRVALVATVVAATALGTDALAAHQIAFATWTFLALALDALAIAAQSLVGHSLGVGDVRAVRALSRRLLVWGGGFGVVVGAMLLVLRPVYVPLFSPDAAVQAQMSGALLIVALMQPVAGWVFVLDGVLLGAGDGRYLAMLSVLVLLPFLPAAWLVASTQAGLPWLWAALGLWMLGRLGFLVARERSDAWLVTGAARR